MFPKAVTVTSHFIPFLPSPSGVWLRWHDPPYKNVSMSVAMEKRLLSHLSRPDENRFNALVTLRSGSQAVVCDRMSLMKPDDLVPMSL